MWYGHVHFQLSETGHSNVLYKACTSSTGSVSGFLRVPARASEQQCEMKIAFRSTGSVSEFSVTLDGISEQQR